MKKFLTVLITFALLLTIFFPLRMSVKAVLSFTPVIYPQYFPIDCLTGTTTPGNGTPFAVYVEILGYTANSSYAIKSRIGPGSTLTYAISWKNETANTWASDSTAYTSLLKVTTDSSGNWRGWLVVKVLNTVTPGTLNYKARMRLSGTTSNIDSSQVSATSLNMSTEGGWIEGGATLDGNPAQNKVVVVKSGSTIVGIYLTEDNGVNEGYSSTPGYFKVGVPAGTGYTVELWDPSTNTPYLGTASGIDVTAGNITSGIVLNTITNVAPTLDWTGETNYGSDGLNPEIGSNITNFVYRIKYTDADDDAPQAGYPKVHILKSSVEIAGSPFSMSEANSGDTIYTDGKFYAYSTTLIPGDYSYYFEAKDLNGASATGAPTISTNGPTVSGDSTPPDIYNFAPPRYSTIYGKRPTISADYSDYSDESPIDTSSVHITVDSVDVTGSSTVTASDVTYTPLSDLSLGTHTVAVSVKDDVGNEKSVSWYFSVIEALSTPNHYLGDIHSHTSYSDGALTPADAFTYARDTANIDFLTITDHSNSLNPTEWTDTQVQANNFTLNGSFVGLAGFEWTNTTQGHINVYNTSTYVSRDDSNYNTLAKFYAWLKTQPDAIAEFNHPFSLQDFDSFAYDPDVDQKITMQEVGNGSPPYSYARLEESYIYSLDKRWHVGATNNQDNHSANWGYPPNNLTGIVANSLTQQDVLAAMRDMRTYGTEDRNLQLSFLANGYWMGSTIPAVEGDLISFHVELLDPDSADRITLVEIITTGGRVLASTMLGSNNVNWDYSFFNPGGGNWYYLKAIEADGDIAISSPIWTPPSDIDLRVTNLTSSPSVAFPGDPVTVTATVINYGLFASNSLSVNFYLGDPSSGGTLIGTDIVDLPVEGTDTASATWVPPAGGVYEIYAVLSGPPEDPIVDNIAILSIKVINAIGKMVLIDRYHKNDYTSESGLYLLTEFADLLKNNGYKILENNAPITADTLQNVDLLIIPYPQSGSGSRDISAGEKTAISSFVSSGGALLFGGKSNYGEDPTRYNDFLTSMDIGINLNHDNIYDDVNNYGYQWSLNLYNFPDTPSGIGKNITNVRFFSGDTLIKPDRTPLVPDPANNIEVLAYANGTSWDEDDTTGLTHVGAGYYTYSYHSNPDGSSMPALAVQTLSNGSRVAVIGRSVFSNYELGNWVNEQAACNNEAFSLNLVDWLCQYNRVMPIAEAREDYNHDGLPDKLGETVTVKGIVTAGSGTFFDVIYVQDETGGITVFGTIPSDRIIPLGAVLQITGVVDSYNGDIEIQFNDFSKDFIWVGWTAEPAPKVFRTGELNLDENEGWLVKTEGFVMQIIDSGTCVIDDGSGPVIVFIDGYIGTLPADLKIGGYISCIGLSGEYAYGHRIRVKNSDEVDIIKDRGLTFDSTDGDVMVLVDPLYGTFRIIVRSINYDSGAIVPLQVFKYDPSSGFCNIVHAEKNLKFNLTCPDGYRFSGELVIVTKGLPTHPIQIKGFRR